MFREDAARENASAVSYCTLEDPAGEENTFRWCETSVCAYAQLSLRPKEELCVTLDVSLSASSPNASLSSQTYSLPHLVS